MEEKRLLLRVCGRTEVGRVRDHNEDRFIIADLTNRTRAVVDGSHVIGECGTLLGICDGMGGAAAGEIASGLGVQVAYETMLAGDAPRDRDELASRLVHAIETAGLRIWREARLDRSRRGMGTTATMAALVDSRAFFGQVGDSRGYVLRGHRLVQVTRDQSFATQLIEEGQLSPAEAEFFAYKNVLLQALGTADTVRVELSYVDLRRGDVVMLCSDGLYTMVRDEQIQEVLTTIESPRAACAALAQLANRAGGQDNITLVVARVEGDFPEASPGEVERLQYLRYDLPRGEQSAVAEWRPTRPQSGQ